MFFYLCKVLYLGFVQINGSFVDEQNNSKYKMANNNNNN